MKFYKLPSVGVVPKGGHCLKRPVRLSLLVVVVLALGVILTVLNVYQLQQMKEEHQNHRSKLITVPSVGVVPKAGHRLKRPARLSLLVVVVLALGVVLTVLNVYQLQQMKEEHQNHRSELITVVEAEAGKDTAGRAPVVWIEGKNMETGYLKHVEAVFQRLGFAVMKKNEGQDWDVLWVHSYPFITMAKTMSSLKPHQRVNKLPGSGFVTNKGSLAVLKYKAIPLAFKIPRDKDKLLKHTKEYPKKMWVQKNNNHRGIKIVPVKELDLETDGTFVQEYVSKPLLIDGRKFDIGIYTVLTSVEPLRIYTVSDEVLVRFCPKDYYPFDAKDTGKYVVSDNYTPMWEMPSLKEMYSKKMYGFKETLTRYYVNKGVDMKSIWGQIEETIQQIYFEKLSLLLNSAKKFSSPRHFFELVRFDFVLDEDMRLYLMEVNMSPNLSTNHFTGNRLLYEQVIYNLLRVTGVASMVENHFQNNEKPVSEMLVADRDIAVFSEWCGDKRCHDNCASMECMLCMPCLSTSSRQIYKDAYLEHINRGSCSRVFPPKLNQSEALEWTSDKDRYSLSQYSDSIRHMVLWFIGMCRKDILFCF